ncbi:MAG: hypothetical protein JXA92_11320, partial [candidate division Zixibacteria bacterium]|nr:hypothetical protein [candidate division Zixibacteria bacterium]
MFKGVVRRVYLTLIIILLSSLQVLAGANPDRIKQYNFTVHDKASSAQASLPDENTVGAAGKQNQPVSLGIAGGDGHTPGALVGHTWYEYQQNSTMGRLIDWRLPNPQVHMAYTRMLTLGGFRTVAYNVYDPESGTWPLTVDVGCNVYDEAQGTAYSANIDVTPAGAAVVAGTVRLTDNIEDPYRTQLFLDTTASSGTYCGFMSHRISDSLNNIGTVENAPMIWPKLEYHVYGDDTCFYALTCEMADYDIRTMTLFRHSGSNLDGTWEAHVIDTIFFPLHDITASRISGKVACCWLEQVPGDSYDDLDVWYLISSDMGATWNQNSKVNVTNYQSGVPGYRAWLELSCLFDTDDHLHILWNANVYDGVSASGRECRIFHWAGHTDVITSVHDAEWDSHDNCGTGGRNVLNTAKVNISECNGRLYAVWIQFGNGYTGDTSDCANLNVYSTAYSANADIYLSVSADLDGSTWDAARNITNTKSPGCDTTAGNECRNERWPSVSRYGMDVTEGGFGALIWDNDALTVDPSQPPDSPYTGNYYLDVMYVNDVSPGSSIQDPSSPAYFVPVKWFRLPCVEPVFEAELVLTPDSIIYPEYTQHGVEKEYTVYVENIGTLNLNVDSIKTLTYTQTGLDWLEIDKTNMSIPSGSPDNIDSLKVTLNKDGVINNPGSIVFLRGIVRFYWDRVTAYDSTDLQIKYFVADTIAGLAWDTVSTNFISLVMSSHGNMGFGSLGKVNMDFYNAPMECDNIEPDTMPGSADVYLHDASPIILRASISGGDTTVQASWAMFDYNFVTPNSFRPVTGKMPPSPYDNEIYESYMTGTFVTSDSTLAVEKTYFAPKEDVSFIIQLMRVYSYDELPHNSLVIGEAFDWDIPSDSGWKNSSGTDAGSDLVYQRGGEWNEPNGDALECQDNDTRFGGAVRIGYYTNHEFNADSTVLHDEPIFGGYADFNQYYVYPNARFDPNELYYNMKTRPGLSAQSSYYVEDQHIVLTYFDDYFLDLPDTLYIWTALATVQNAAAGVNDLLAIVDDARNWFDSNRYLLTGNLCNVYCGDLDKSGKVNLADITRFMAYLYYLGGSAPDPLCSADMDGLEGVTNNDICALIDNLYLSREPLDCNARADTSFPISVSDSVIIKNNIVAANSSDWGVEIWYA